jgi:hypothetical protein
MMVPPPLTFAAVDGLGFAAAAGRLEAAKQTERYAPASLGRCSNYSTSPPADACLRPLSAAGLLKTARVS